MENINLKVPANIYKTVSDLFETKEGMLKDFLFSIAIVKVSCYRKREELYEKKYGQSFKKFEKMILDKDRKENFEEWDDYILWKAIHEAYNLWSDKYKKLEKCST